jgi:hypothetical protein
MEKERAEQQKLMEERINAGGADMEKERDDFEKRMQDQKRALEDEKRRQ